MAYRPLKRVRGETTLEKKCRRWFGLALFVLIATSFWIYGWRTDDLVNQRNSTLGDSLVGVALLEKHAEFLSSDGDFRIDDNRNTPPSASSGQDHQQRSFEHIKDYFRSQSFSWHAILPQTESNQGQANAPQDELEWSLHDEWLKLSESLHTDGQIEEQSDIFKERSARMEDQQTYQYYQPVFAQQKCIGCHTAFGTAGGPALEVGDLLAIMRIEFDEAPTVAAQNWNRALLLTTAVVTTLLSMFALYVIVRYVIVKPLKHLRDVSNAVREGDVEQRAEIKTGDEFEELAAAFNRMVRQLLSQQSRLTDMNVALDAKIEELAQANMRLFELNQLKSDFLSTISHELRTPLNSILGFSDVLAELDVLDAKQKRYADNIRKSGRILLEMINDILDLAKMESGKMKLKTTEFRIEALVTSICDLARPLSEKKNIELVNEVQPNLPILSQDESKVRQILNNLVSNAIKFTPEGGKITVRVRRDGDAYIRLIVSDTGVGISADEQELIFEKFRQGTTVSPDGSAMTREYSGTGLGLSIVKELSRLLGGDVTLQSQLGVGSEFVVRLPVSLSIAPKLDADFVEEVDDFNRRMRLPASTERLGKATGEDEQPPSSAVTTGSVAPNQETLASSPEPQ